MAQPTNLSLKLSSPNANATISRAFIARDGTSQVCRLPSLSCILLGALTHKLEAGLLCGWHQFDVQ